MVANTGTYVDAPAHRYADAADLADLPLDRLADLPGRWCRRPDRRSTPPPSRPTSGGTRCSFTPTTPGTGLRHGGTPASETGGIVGGMRRKTSLTLDETTIAAAHAGAERDGKPLSQWVEQAILNEVGRTDVALIEEWEQALPNEDRAVLAAFAEADRLADLDR
jgi:hypothetical protein